MPQVVTLLDAPTTLQEGQVVSCYYPDTKTGVPTPRKGKVLKVTETGVTVETSRGPRTLNYARMQGTLKIHD